MARWYRARLTASLSLFESCAQSGSTASRISHVVTDLLSSRIPYTVSDMPTARGAGGLNITEALVN